MKYQLMTDGRLTRVVATPFLNLYQNLGWVKVGPPFKDLEHAKEHAAKLN